MIVRTRTMKAPVFPERARRTFVDRTFVFRIGVQRAGVWRARLSILSAGLALLAGAAMPAHAQQRDDEPAPRLPYDQVRPPIADHMRSPAMLVFTKTEGYRHNEGIAGASAFFARHARAAGQGFFLTENGAVFNADDLARFDLVVFNNVSGDALDAAQERALKNWFEAGGGLISLHGSGTARPADWDWYAQTLIGPQFTNHPADPQFQEARLENLATDHPVMEAVPAEWRAVDEWYSFDGRAQDYGALPLFGLDESTYAPVNHRYGNYSDLRMGAGAINHPIAWVVCAGDGRAFYSALGHYDTAYDDPIYQRILTNAIMWARGSANRSEGACAHGAQTE